MPNYVTNRITLDCSAEKVNEILEFMKTEESIFDFNKLIPMPKSLDIESGSRGQRGMDAIRSGKTDGIDEETLELGRIYLENKKKYGYITWFEWRHDNWGTKWNSVEAYIDDNVIHFDTAWSLPKPIVHAFFEKFKIPFTWDFADEDCGNNCGICESDGETLDVNYFKNGSKEAVAHSVELLNLYE